MFLNLKFHFLYFFPVCYYLKKQKTFLHCSNYKSTYIERSEGNKTSNDTLANNGHLWNLLKEVANKIEIRLGKWPWSCG